MDTYGIIKYGYIWYNMVMIGTVSCWHDLKQARKIKEDQKVVVDVDGGGGWKL